MDKARKSRKTKNLKGLFKRLTKKGKKKKAHTLKHTNVVFFWDQPFLVGWDFSCLLGKVVFSWID